MKYLPLIIAGLAALLAFSILASAQTPSPTSTAALETPFAPSPTATPTATPTPYLSVLTTGWNMVAGTAQTPMQYMDTDPCIEAVYYWDNVEKVWLGSFRNIPYRSLAIPFMDSRLGYWTFCAGPEDWLPID